MEESIYSYQFKGVKLFTPNKRFAWMRPRPLGKKIRIVKKSDI